MIEGCANLDGMEWSVRTAFALQRAGLVTVSDVRRLGRQGILRVPNIGRKSLREIEEVIGVLPEYTDIIDLATVPTTSLLAEVARRIYRAPKAPK